MNIKMMIGALLLYGVLLGFFDGYYLAHHEAMPVMLKTFMAIVLNVANFIWYRLDSDAHRFKRTIWWNVAVVALSVLIVPVYVLCSRPKGRRILAILKSLGLILLLILIISISRLVFYGALS